MICLLLAKVIALGAVGVVASPHPRNLSVVSSLDDQPNSSITQGLSLPRGSSPSLGDDISCGQYGNLRFGWDYLNERADQLTFDDLSVLRSFGEDLSASPQVDFTGFVESRNQLIMQLEWFDRSVRLSNHDVGDCISKIYASTLNLMHQQPLRPPREMSIVIFTENVHFSTIIGGSFFINGHVGPPDSIYPTGEIAELFRKNITASYPPGARRLQTPSMTVTSLRALADIAESAAHSEDDPNKTLITSGEFLGGSFTFSAELLRHDGLLSDRWSDLAVCIAAQYQELEYAEVLKYAYECVWSCYDIGGQEPIAAGAIVFMSRSRSGQPIYMTANTTIPTKVPVIEEVSRLRI